jgi:hypothetical protein
MQQATLGAPGQPTKNTLQKVGHHGLQGRRQLHHHHATGFIRPRAGGTRPPATDGGRPSCSCPGLPSSEIAALPYPNQKPVSNYPSHVPLCLLMHLQSPTRRRGVARNFTSIFACSGNVAWPNYSTALHASPLRIAC